METSNEAQDAVPGTTSTVVDENSTSEFVLPSDAPDTLATHQQQHDLLTIDEPWKFAASSTTFEDATYLEEVDPSHVQDSLLSNHQVETVDSYDFLDSWSFNIPNIDDDTQSLAAPAVVNLNQGNMEDSYFTFPSVAALPPFQATPWSDARSLSRCQSWSSFSSAGVRSDILDSDAYDIRPPPITRSSSSFFPPSVPQNAFVPLDFTAPVSHLENQQRVSIVTGEPRARKRRLADLSGVKLRSEPGYSSEEDGGIADLKLPSGSETKNKIFACPFMRKNPLKHLRCLNIKLTRIRDLKQHLRRAHYPTKFYCPICFDEYQTRSAWEQHIESRQCQPQDPLRKRNPDTVSQEAQRTLAQRSDRRKSDLEQYYTIWDDLFHGAPRPHNPYMGGTVEEVVDIVGDIWRGTASEILALILESNRSCAEKSKEMDSLLLKVVEEVKLKFKH